MNENVMIPMCRLGRLSEAEMREHAAKLLEAVDLGDKLQRPSRHLSGGERATRGRRSRARQRSAGDPGRLSERQSRHEQFTASPSNCWQILFVNAEKLYFSSLTIASSPTRATGP
jgi:hypothetical protein